MLDDQRQENARGEKNESDMWEKWCKRFERGRMKSGRDSDCEGKSGDRGEGGGRQKGRSQTIGRKRKWYNEGEKDLIQKLQNKTAKNVFQLFSGCLLIQKRASRIRDIAQDEDQTEAVQSKAINFPYVQEVIIAVWVKNSGVAWWDSGHTVFFFFFYVPRLYLWGSPFLGEIFAYVCFSNPTIKVVTFCLCGWCVLGVILLPAFTRLGHERQDLLSPCDEMYVCTD